MKCQHFLNGFIETFNKHAAMKQKYRRANQGRFMKNHIHKAIMKRSRLRNKLLSDRAEMYRKEYKKQQTFCLNFMERARKGHFGKS